MVREIIFRSITASAISIVHKGNLSKECTDSLGISKGTVISAEYCLKTFCHSGLKKNLKKKTKNKTPPFPLSVVWLHLQEEGTRAHICSANITSSFQEVEVDKWLNSNKPNGEITLES